MNVDDILIIVILVILIVYVYRGCKCESEISPIESTDSEQESVDGVEEIDINAYVNANVNANVNEEIESMSNISNVTEGMAPLNFGTFYDNYPRGQCRTGKFWERKSCEVGNCPLGTTVSDQQFCHIQCAQDPDPEERQRCYEVCMKNLC